MLDNNEMNGENGSQFDPNERVACENKLIAKRLYLLLGLGARVIASETVVDVNRVVNTLDVIDLVDFTSIRTVSINTNFSVFTQRAAREWALQLAN